MSEQTQEPYDEIEEEFGIEGLDEMEEGDERLEENEAFSQPPKKKLNWNALGIILLLLIGLIGIVFYAAVWLPQQRAQQLARQAMENVAQTEMAVNEPQTAAENAPSIEDTQIVFAPTENVDFAATQTKAYEPTPVYAILSPTVILKEEDDLDPIRTATVAALLTEAALISQPTESPQETLEPSVPLTPIADLPTAVATPLATALPRTGWMEDVGLPSMGIIALGLILVLIIVRVIRTSRSVP